MNIKIYPILCFALVGLVSSFNVSAYSFVPTEVEYQSWSAECKAAYGGSNSGRTYGFDKRAPDLGKAFSALNWRIGGWHYCGGVIKIRRAELSTNTREREKNFLEGIQNANYSYSRIDKTNLWAAEMATTIARGYRGLGDIEKAKDHLDEAIRYHPKYPGAYVLYAMLYFDAEDYAAAKEYLLKANDAARGLSSEINYFLGLASIELGELAEAKKFAAEAARLGYPLTGLQDKIKALENADSK